MPIYEYECKSCHREFEYQQRMSDPDKTVCEACGAEQLSRIISRTAFQLKGSGWYKDLYASAKPGASTSESKGSSSAESGSSAAASTPTTTTPTSSTGSTGGGSSSGGSSSGGSSSGGGGPSTGGGSSNGSSGSSSKAAASAS